MSRAEKNIAGNIYDFYKRIAELCGYEKGMVAGCSYVWNRDGSWPSFVLGSPDPHSIPVAVEAMKDGDVPPFWIMEKPARNEAQELEEAGIRAIREWSGMELHSDQFQPGYTSGDRIRIRINEPEFSSSWLKIVNEDLLTGSQMEPEVLEYISRTDQFRWMVAFLDGQPVGTGLSYSEKGVCGLYMITTVASFRGRGVGTQVTTELIRQAMASGDKLFVLHSTELGARIYRKLGFRNVNRFSVLWNLGH